MDLRTRLRRDGDDDVTNSTSSTRYWHENPDDCNLDDLINTEYVESSGGMALIISETGVDPDCEFRFSDTDHTLKTHRSTLAKESEVFRAMFYGSHAEPEFPIYVADVSFDVFTEMVKYILYQKSTIPDVDFACDLHYAANKYFVAELKHYCVEYLFRYLEPSNLCSILQYALFVDQKFLLKECISLIKSKTLDILNDSNINEYSLDVLEFIFSQKSMSIESELTLFAAAERYARAQDAKMLCNVQTIEKSREESEGLPITGASSLEDEGKLGDEENILKSSACRSSTSFKKEKTDVYVPWISQGPRLDSPIRRLLHQIRFLAMSPRELAEADLSSLITWEEKAALLENLVSSKARTPMPPMFQLNRRQRTRTQRCVSTVLHTSTHLNQQLSRAYVQLEVVIQYISTLQYFESMPIYLANKTWRVIVQPYVADNKAYYGRDIKYLSVYLKCASEMEDDWFERIEFHVKLMEKRYLSRSFQPLPPYVQVFNTHALFSKTTPLVGTQLFVEWGKVLTTKEHDSITLEVGIYCKGTSAPTLDEFQTRVLIMKKNYPCENWVQYIFPEREYSSIELQRKWHSDHRMLCERHFRVEDFADSTKTKLLRTAAPSDAEYQYVSDSQPGLLHFANPQPGPSQPQPSLNREVFRDQTNKQIVGGVVPPGEIDNKKVPRYKGKPFCGSLSV